MYPHWLRHPRTTQERRANQFVRGEDRVPIRGRRASHMLPQAYDDIQNKSLRSRNWKRLRGTQYRVKECYSPPEPSDTARNSQEPPPKTIGGSS